MRAPLEHNLQFTIRKSFFDTEGREREMVATRLLLLRGRVPTATTVARSLGAQQHFRSAAGRTATANGARHVVRSFSFATGNGNDNNKDDEDDHHHNGLNGDAATNGDVNPFERLLHHSQQFRQQMAEAEKSGVEFAFVEEKDEDDDDDDDDDAEEEKSEEAPDADGDSDSDSDSDSDDEVSDDNGGVSAVAERYSKRSETRSRRPPTCASGSFNADRAARTARSVKRRILNASEDELDYEHELSKLQYSRAKERKYQQLIHREQDKDRVCRNCGERGHVAKHCLLPMICSNCGGIGHRMRDCVYPDYTSEVEEDAERFGKKKKKQQKAQSEVEKQRMGMRYDKFKEEFDSQIEEYLEDSAIAAEKRNKRKAEKLAQKQEQASQDFDPVIG